MQPCGAFGLSLLVDEESNVTELCYPGQMAKGAVTQGSLVSVDLWHLRRARVDLRCYLWATGTGRMPTAVRPNGTDTAEPDLVPKIVSTTRKIQYNPTNTASVNLVMGCPNARTGVRIVKKRHLRATPISTLSLITPSGVAVVALVVPILVGKSCLISGSHYSPSCSQVNSTTMTKGQELTEKKTRDNLSPVRIYQFTPAAADSCSAAKCKRIHVFTYHGTRACKFRLICSKLEGDPCGSYGQGVPHRCKRCHCRCCYDV